MVCGVDDRQQEKPVIERYVYIRLKPEHCAEREAIAARSLEVLTGLPHVTEVRVGIPCDEHSDKAWDLSLAARFATMDELNSYREHPEHRALVDDYLAPRTKVVKAWNFSLQAG